MKIFDHPVEILGESPMRGVRGSSSICQVLLREPSWIDVPLSCASSNCKAMRPAWWPQAAFSNAFDFIACVVDDGVFVMVVIGRLVFFSR